MGWMSIFGAGAWALVTLAAGTPLPAQAQREALSSPERSALAELSEDFATVYRPVDSWFAGRPVQYYHFGPSAPDPGILYRIQGGGAVVSSIPGLPGYSALRQIFDVEILPSAGVAPAAVRSHDHLLELVARKQARLRATGLVHNLPIVPGGSRLEHDPTPRPLLEATFKGQTVHYFDFGPSRPGAIPLLVFAQRFPADALEEVARVAGQATLVSDIPGNPGYSDLWDVQVAVGSGYAPGDYRDYRRTLADVRAGKLAARPRRSIVNCPVVYVDARPAARPAARLATNGPLHGEDASLPLGENGGAGAADNPPVTISAAGVTATPPLTSLPPDGAGAAGLVYAGIAGLTSLAPPRVDATVVIDGVLDEAVWQRAARLTGFSQFRPSEGRPAEDSTEAYVWYSPTAIHIGIRAYAPPGTVRASLAERDKIDKEDYVQILLDTFNDRRQAFAFGVNAFGVQADGVKTEGSQQPRAPGAGGGQQGQGGPGGQQGPQEGFDRGLDLSPDFVWQSKGRLTGYGYEVEVRIPFKSLRYQSRPVQDWGINVLRKVQRSGYEDTWTRTARSASFLGQSGVLRGLHDLQRGVLLEVNPFTLGRLEGAADTTLPASWRYRGTPEIGANVRWGMTTALTLSGAVNPDFSQVEADAAQAPPDPRFAVFFQEKRPFFVEGIEQFTTPAQLIYTRRITDPVGAMKLTGKVGATAIGVLSAVDNTGGSATGTDYPVYNLARLRRDIGNASTAGLVYTDKIDGSNYNRVAVADARFVFGKVYSLTLNAGGSLTRTAGADTRGALWDVWSDRSGRRYGFSYRIQGFGSDFQAQSGFVRRTGVVLANLANRFTITGRRGAFLESWTGRFTYNGTWNYGEFFDRKRPVETRIGFSNQWTLRGGWTVTLNPLFEIFHFDPAFHADYYVERVLPGGARDTIPFVVATDLRNYDAIGRIETPQFRWGSMSVNWTWSPHDLDLYEFATAGLLSLTAVLDLKPTEKLRINAQYTRRYLTRARDHSHVVTTDIPRLKLEYQIARPLFLRFVGQYDARTRDALRDPRTDAPILIRGSGSYAPAARQVTNDLRVDALLSYQPNPGTVVFAGYGSSLTETEAFTFRAVHRVRDGFFMKVSYLFRM